MDIMPKEIIAAVHRAGIVGAGGGGFPAHVKFNSQVDTVIANGSECEPLLNSDRALLRDNAGLVIKGLHHVMVATGAKAGFIAIKDTYPEVVAAVNKELKGNQNIQIFILDNYYPAGDEFLTVFDVTGRIIPEGGIPLQVGVLVSNVLSLAQVAHALSGKAVTERPVTVAGSVHKPLVATVPIGTLYQDLIDLAGGKKNPTDILFDGGPMMGNVVDDPGQGIAKTTSGVMVLPEDHLVSRMKRITISQMVKKSKAACCQCIRCSDLCPRNLIGHKLFPHKTMLTIDYNMAEPTDHITAAFLCSQCGVCELIACDVMELSPRKVYAEYKDLLISQGISNPHNRVSKAILPEIEYRKIPLPTVVKKIGISEYDKDIAWLGYKSMNRVSISLNRHTGAPAIPKVVTGDKVKMGDVIASSPLGESGTIYHSSIAGKVTDVSEIRIEITGDV